ncbi:MAG: cyclohexadieny/prephenate dehydrogenase [Halieaceae bacterium]|jgi:cyclohexadieny/prephenate dehydrogenase
MSYRQDTVVILGLGLIGGSLARSLRATGFSQRIVGWGHREPSLSRGVELGVIDSFTLNLEEAVAQADILVVATPTLIAADMLQEILPLLPEDDSGPVITDVASVKGSLRSAVMAANGRMPPRLVLGHPIAGSERSGVEASSAGLFQRHRVILTPEQDTDSKAVDLIRAMWESTGAEVVAMSVANHDAVLAATSHLPHVLAYALVDALAQADSSEDIFRFAAGGFRDFTRIASSDPVMWKDIAIANKGALLDSLGKFEDHLVTLRAAIEAEDSEALLATFTRAKESRDRFTVLLDARDSGHNTTRD